MFCGGSKSAKGGPNPLADMDRGVQIRCDNGTVAKILQLIVKLVLLSLSVQIYFDSSVLFE